MSGSLFTEVIEVQVGGWGGGGVLNKVLYGETSPEVQPLTLLYIIFDRKGPPFL